MTCRITSAQPVTTPKPVPAKAAEPALTPAQHLPVAFACGGMGQDSYVGGAGAAIARAVPLPTADASIISHNGGNLISNSGGTLLPEEGASLMGGGAGGGKMVIVQPTQPAGSLLDNPLFAYLKELLAPIREPAKQILAWVSALFV